MPNLILQELFALTRLASVNKPILSDFSVRGVNVKPVDYSLIDDLVDVLTGMDVVISTLTLLNQKEQMDIIEASSKAKVRRFVPSFFGPVCPPKGVMRVRDAVCTAFYTYLACSSCIISSYNQLYNKKLIANFTCFWHEQKEDLLHRIKFLYLPYTAIDIGWWYQLALPQLPSGRIKTKVDYALNERMGNGEALSALTDNRDIGKFVARIIADPRTLNRMVFAYGEVWTQNQIIATLEEKSGEKVATKTVSCGFFFLLHAFTAPKQFN